MGRLIVSAQMTIDGVMDQIDGWFDDTLESERFGVDQLRAADALLLGRETYVGLSSVWPTMSDPQGYADLVNSIPKFVASRTLQEPLEWNATLIKGDLIERVTELKQELPGNLLSYGCGQLANELARRGVVDEVRLWVNPVVWGDGVRPLHAGTLPIRMRLIGATTFSSGVVLQSYAPISESGR
jgi:dihydrofolate reductase